MVGRVGFEPTTNGLKGRCSTTELPTQKRARPNILEVIHDRSRIKVRRKLNDLPRWRKDFSQVFWPRLKFDISSEPPPFMTRLV
jgi:hypothetical protein